jgi:hypothetical protein
MRSPVVMLIVCASLMASQIFYMDLDQAVWLADYVMVVEVSHVVHFHMDYLDRMEYTFRILEVVHGDGVWEGDFLTFYTFDLPRSYTDADGNEVWESPFVTGSGMEMFVEEGDTVIALVYSPPCDASRPAELVRLEPPGSLETITQLLEGTSTAD